MYGAIFQSNVQNNRFKNLLYLKPCRLVFDRLLLQAISVCPRVTLRFVDFTEKKLEQEVT